MKTYKHKEVEKKWQDKWTAEGLYKTGEDSDKPKYYILDMFPYPSGAGLHVGHPKGYIATDIMARMKMMQGFNVLHPMGWDAFGLPAENFAIKNKVHPRPMNEKNIATYKSQLMNLGFTYDWDREINTTDPEYYKWTQWAFLQMFNKGLAYESNEPINWCPNCQTGLANEDLEDGRCERCDSEIEQRPMRQWVLKITDYADRMLADLDKLPDWPDAIKEMQRNWIGKSSGAKVKFEIKPQNFSQNDADATPNNAESDLLYKDLTYKIRGALFNVRKSVGLGHKESVYHKALEIEFEKQGLSFESEKRIDVKHEGQKVGVYQPDFIIDDKVIIELKALPKIGKQQLNQTWTYLKGSDYKLALLVNYSPSDLEIKRTVYDSARESKNSASSASVPHNSATSLEVFTTRPDTLFGCTFMVVAPEHSLIKDEEPSNSASRLKIKNLEEIREYQNQAKRKTELERTDLAKDKTGVKIEGLSAVNPVNGEEIPIFVADYVMMGYGTGAIMAVPAHDARDMEFAKKYDIPVRQVVAPMVINKGDGAPKDNLETVRRKNVIAIVKHWSEDKYICLDWKGYEWKSFVIGGIDEGETVEEAAIREAKEETGYQNIKAVKSIGGNIFAKYFAAHKGVNRLADFEACYLELEDGEHVEPKAEDVEFHDFEWVEKDRVGEYINLPHHEWYWDALINGDQCFSGHGENINSDFLNGLETDEAKDKIITWLEEKGLGERAVTYKLKDWVFGRQRYWGEPIPIVHCSDCGPVAVPEEELPVKLPDVESYEPTGTGESPLADIDDWVNTTCSKCGGPAKRETNTMPQWAGSCWYYLRYIDPKNDKALVDKDKEVYWSPVDFYVGGAEHATRHLIYARFWHKFLFDIGVVSHEEPFTRLQHVGLIMAEDGRKMSKRWGNVINPDDIVESHGADAMRVYEMFMGPFAQSCAWSTSGLIGAKKFLEKVYKIAMSDSFVDCGGSCKNIPKDLPGLLHKTIKKVGEDIEQFRFNTAISQMMILVNAMQKAGGVPKVSVERLLQILAPFAPHMAEELWQHLGHKASIFKEPWPSYNPDLIQDDVIELIIQINGKVRAKMEASANITEQEAKDLALGDEKVKKWVDGKEVVKVIFVAGKLVNIVVK